MEYTSALEQGVVSIYKDSWPALYFNLDALCYDSTVYFVEKKKRARDVQSLVPIDSNRFNIYVFVPQSSKAYFFPLSQWQEITAIQDAFVKTDIISKIPHGFKTKSFPTSNSLFYTTPYFLTFKSPAIPRQIGRAHV